MKKVAFFLPIIIAFLYGCGGHDCSKFSGVYVRGYEWGELAKKSGYRHNEEEIRLNYGVGIADNALPCLYEGYKDGYKGKENRYPDGETTVWAPPQNSSNYNDRTESKQEVKEIESSASIPNDDDGANEIDLANEKTCTVNGINVNVRSGPGKIFDVIFQIDKGEYFKLVSGFDPKDDVVGGVKGKWYMIETNEKKEMGWVFDTFLQCE